MKPCYSAFLGAKYVKHCKWGIIICHRNWTCQKYQIFLLIRNTMLLNTQLHILHGVESFLRTWQLLSWSINYLFFYESNVQYHIHKITHYFLGIHLSIILPFMPRLWSDLPSKFSNHNLVYFSHLSYVRHVLTISSLMTYPFYTYTQTQWVIFIPFWS